MVGAGGLALHDAFEVRLDGVSEDLWVELGTVDVPGLSVLVVLHLVDRWHCRCSRRRGGRRGISRRTTRVICATWRHVYRRRR